MSHIFISYSRKDSEVVDEIVARLVKDGFNVWIDREKIKGGELWRESIVEAIDNAHSIILMLSPNSVASDNVRKEVDLAEGSGRPLVPVLLAPAKLSARLRYQLAGIQWIECFNNPKAKYDEIVLLLNPHQKTADLTPESDVREVEIVIGKAKLSKFGQEQREKLLKLISEITDTPLSEINIARMTSGSVHAFVNMTAISAYRLKIAAHNRALRLVRFGINAIRLSGDRHFVLLQTGKIGPIKPQKPWFRNWFFGGMVIIAALLGFAIYNWIIAPPPIESYSPTSMHSLISSSVSVTTVATTQTYVFTSFHTKTPSTPYLQSRKLPL